MTEQHYYVYVHGRTGSAGTPYYWYERTCGTEQAAKDRVAELARRGVEALYLVNHVIKNAYY